jgi:hypothetical protein
MKVTVMYRNNWFGGDGWTYYPVEIEIGDTCPVCGGPRGEPYGYNFIEDDTPYFVHKWDNPCGHMDLYADVLVEAGYVKREK